MMRTISKTLLLFSLVFFSLALKGQEQWLVFQIVDAQDSLLLSDALILEPRQNVILAQTNANGYFAVKTTQQKIKVQLFGYQSRTVDLTVFKNKNSNKIGLSPSVELLNTVELQAEPFKKKREMRSFEFWQNGLVALSKINYKLLVTNFDVKLKYEIDAPEIDGKKAHALQSDVEGNVFLVGKERVMQIFITDSVIYTYPTHPIEEFNYYVKNLKVVLNNGKKILRNTYMASRQLNIPILDSGYLFNTNITHPVLHNCGTEFIVLNGGGEKEVVYRSLDTSAYYAAQNQFYQFLGMYILAEGSVLDRRWGMALHTYKSLYAKFQEVPMFYKEGNIIVFDALTNKLVKLNSNFEITQMVDFDFKESTKNWVAIQDQGNQRIWLFSRKNGRDEIQELFLDLSVANQTYQIGTFVRNLRIRNNVVFYLDQDNTVSFFTLGQSVSLRD